MAGSGRRRHVTTTLSSSVDRVHLFYSTCSQHASPRTHRGSSPRLLLTSPHTTSHCKAPRDTAPQTHPRSAATYVNEKPTKDDLDCLWQQRRVGRCRASATINTSYGEMRQKLFKPDECPNSVEKLFTTHDLDDARPRWRPSIA